LPDLLTLQEECLWLKEKFGLDGRSGESHPNSCLNNNSSSLNSSFYFIQQICSRVKLNYFNLSMELTMRYAFLSFVPETLSPFIHLFSSFIFIFSRLRK